MVARFTLHNFFSNERRFTHTSTVTRLHSCSGKKYSYVPRASCFYRDINILNILRQNIQQKVLVVHSVLRGACPKPCSNRADTIL